MTGRARVIGGDGLAVRWECVPFARPGAGLVVFEDPAATTTVMHAFLPNKTRIKVQMLHGDRIVCFDDLVEVSVPQFFRVTYNDKFLRDLERLGLRRRDPPPWRAYC